MLNKKTLAIGMMILATPALARTAAAQVEPGLLARETAKEYRERARFPESSRVIKRGESDPIREKRTPTRQTMKGPDGAEPVLSVWTSKVSYEKSQPVDLYASLEMKGKAFSLAAEINAEIADASGAIVAGVAYRDDGRVPDVKAGDGVWSTRLTLPEGLSSAPAESFMVRVKARLLDGDLREAAGGFLLSAPAARLTGRYRDSLKDGNLVVAAEVDVTEPGRFHLAGTLYSLQGEPVGWAQAAANLEPGRHWVELSYYGLIFHDRQVAGPFRLGTLSLATTGVMPNALNDLVENAHVTRPYNLRQFRDLPFGDRGFLETAKRLEL
ncbi:MAG TPA: hypothetical protein VE685_17670, partial [Thermoanaerobaculia bacterium]|nr:hypothetical protein [Thermoanaerobaculia bacterium]